MPPKKTTMPGAAL
jgi:hypothetical protein